ncbi:MAG: hypothetical protein M3Z46_06970 [Actinomycetota bacterium]|nr:hypothetical protein [Actinomycetota bacterium]
MNDSFKRASGRKVISRATAQDVGAISHLLVDTERRAVVALIIGKGKRAELFDWDQVTGFGPDAVLVAEQGALRAPADDHERLAASGGLDLVGKRALSEKGTNLGAIDDVSFDPSTGVLDVIHIGDREISARALLGHGSYAAVLDADEASS